MDDLKSIAFTSLFEVTYDVDVPASSEIPPATTEDVTMDDMIAFSSEVEINKDHLGEQDFVIYDNLTYAGQMALVH